MIEADLAYKVACLDSGSYDVANYDFPSSYAGYKTSDRCKEVHGFRFQLGTQMLSLS